MIAQTLLVDAPLSAIDSLDARSDLELIAADMAVLVKHLERNVLRPPNGRLIVGLITFCSFGQNIADFYRRITFGFAIVGGLHEGENLNGFLG
jgi:hypothetical protein